MSRGTKKAVSFAGEVGQVGENEKVLRVRGKHAGLGPIPEKDVKRRKIKTNKILPSVGPRM